MMKFGCTVALQYDTPFSPFGAGEFEEALLWLRESGFDGAELCISDYENCDVIELKERLDSYGLACPTISTGQALGRENISLLHTGTALDRAQERLCRHIDAAKVLGSKVTIGLLRGDGRAGRGGMDGMEGGAGERRKLLAEHMAPVIHYAKKQGVILLLEPINRYETGLLNGAVETLKFIENELGGEDCVEILWDVFHANLEDASLYTIPAAIKSHFGHVHLADSNRWFPGFGHLDFPGILRGIRDAGYAGYYSFECLNRPSVEVVRTQAKGFVQYMRGLLEAGEG